MQSQESKTGTAGPVKHPETGDWMSLLYGETTPDRKRELESHLQHCPQCQRQIALWRQTMSELDQWKLKFVPGIRRLPVPFLKWAAAAAIVLSVGFVLGREAPRDTKELIGLKASVTQLKRSIETLQGATLSNSVAAATVAANAETVRLLAQFSRLQEDRRISDQQSLALTLNDFDKRLSQLRTELETVAVNTETGFEETHENLTRLASLSIPANSSESQTKPQ